MSTVQILLSVMSVIGGILLLVWLLRMSIHAMRDDARRRRAILNKTATPDPCLGEIPDDEVCPRCGSLSSRRPVCANCDVGDLKAIVDDAAHSVEHGHIENAIGACTLAMTHTGISVKSSSGQLNDEVRRLSMVIYLIDIIVRMKEKGGDHE